LAKFCLHLPLVRVRQVLIHVPPLVRIRMALAINNILRPRSAMTPHVFSPLSRLLPDGTSKLADDPEATKREMRMIQRESWKVRRSEGQKVLGALMMLNRAQGRISL